MISPISLFLPEFSAPPAMPEPEFELPPELDAFETPLEALEANPDGDPDASLIEARAEGFAEGSATLEVALAAQAAELEAQHQQALEAARAQWVVEAAGEFAVALQSALDDLERRIADGVADAFEPVLGVAMRGRLTRDLHEAVSTLVANGQGTAIRLAGPADLIEPLQAAFEGRATIEATTTEAGEVEVEADGTLIRSQLGPWAQSLRSVLEESP